jgi:carbon-monoxide dehydrogenase large subunit/6-hydroxypseudooxynicotine dehydrogenase subunit gamma
LQEPDPDRLGILNGRIIRSDRPNGPSIALAEIAASLAPGVAIKRGYEPGLCAEGIFAADHLTYPYGVHVAAVTVDRDTGRVKIDRYLAAYDVGVAVNPMLVEGQITGSMAQGLGGALLEEFTYDESGTPLVVNFADYLMPTCREVPRLDVLLTEDAPSPLNPLGVKGAGESGITGVGAALVSAINDALGAPGAVTQLPITPARLKHIMDGLPPREPT